jgi:hypothetical protein
MWLHVSGSSFSISFLQAGHFCAPEEVFHTSREGSYVSTAQLMPPCQAFLQRTQKFWVQ